MVSTHYIIMCIRKLMYIISKGNGNPSQYSYLENPMEPGMLQSMELQRVSYNSASEQLYI